MKSLLKSVLRPFFRVTQRVFARTLSLSNEPILAELKDLRSQLEHSDRHPTFGTDPVRCYRPFTRQEMTHDTRVQARQRLGISQDRQLVLSLGTVTFGKGVIECLHALEQLRYWGAFPLFYFVGRIDPEIRPELLSTIASLSLADSVHFHEEKYTEPMYRDFLIAADCAVQIQIQNPDVFSGAYLDCISAGLPTVSNIDLAILMNTPSFVATIPNELSPLLIAEKLLELYHEWETKGPFESKRERNVAEHALTNYSPQILKLLLAS